MGGGELPPLDDDYGRRHGHRDGQDRVHGEDGGHRQGGAGRTAALGTRDGLHHRPRQHRRGRCARVRQGRHAVRATTGTGAGRSVRSSTTPRRGGPAAPGAPATGTPRQQDPPEGGQQPGELCFTPTNASWANPVEAHSGPLRQFALTNSHRPSHSVLTRAPHLYLHWRSQNARHPDVLAAQRRERARIRSEKGIRWGSRPLHPAA